MSEEIRSTTMHDAHPLAGEQRTPRKLSRAGAAGVAGVLLIGGVFGAVAVSGASGASASTTTASARTASASVVASAAAAAKLKSATDEALLAVLLTDLPKGSTGHYAKLPKFESNDPKYTVQTYLDKGRGPGQIRLSLSTPKAIAAYAKLLTSTHLGTAKSWKLKNGDRVTALTNSTDCIQARTVAVERKDGSVAQLDLAGCLIWNNKLNPKGRYALTQAQAITVGEDTRLATKMTAAQIRKGAKEFPHLIAIA